MCERERERMCDSETGREKKLYCVLTVMLCSLLTLSLPLSLTHTHTHKQLHAHARTHLPLLLLLCFRTSFPPPPPRTRSPSSFPPAWPDSPGCDCIISSLLSLPLLISSHSLSFSPSLSRSHSLSHFLDFS